ncbi:MAG: D-alanine--poly(phosphoribitol) ligase subunit 2 [Acetanaerobacterium sp.]
MKEVREEVLDILARVCGEEEIRRNDAIDLLDTQLLDSLALISLLGELEDRLGIELQPSRVSRESLRTPNSIVALVAASLKAGGEGDFPLL